MSWYYAENNERRGPVDDDVFDGLVRSGAILPDTLVWREGMQNWTAFSQAGYAPAAAEAAPPEAPGEMGVCSESGRILPRSELVEIEGRLVSAEYKDIVLQRLREGVGAAGAAEDPEAIAQRIEAAGWSISPGACVRRGWATMKGNFWLCAGATFLVYLVIIAAGIVPFGGIVVQGPLFGGLYIMILKMLRGEPAAVGDAFQGFNRGWGHLIGVTVVTTLLAAVCLLPGTIALVMSGVSTAQESRLAIGVVASIFLLGGVVVATKLTVEWVFALPLVADKQLEFWPAMKLSRRIVRMHWWQIFGVLFIAGMMMFGVLVVGVLLVAMIVGLGSLSKDTGIAFGLGMLGGLVVAFGFFALIPLLFSALSVAYEEIFSMPRGG